MWTQLLSVGLISVYFPFLLNPIIQTLAILATLNSFKELLSLYLGLKSGI